MIKVKIRETGLIETLQVVDAKGTDFTADMIGNHGGFSPEQFALIEDTGVYEADRETYGWWAKVLADIGALEVRLAELYEDHGYEAVNEAVLAAGHVDLEDHAANLNRELDEAFGARV